MFNRSNIAITGGTFTQVRGETDAFKRLQKACAPAAFHDSSARFDPPKCHPNTRDSVLEYIMDWIFRRNDPDALILWLYGPAGAGKSAILQTIAERCFERLLLASFFFGRSDPTRNTIEPLIPTIAFQIAITLPQITPLIESAIERDPFIFDKSIDTQFKSLITDPIKEITASDPKFFHASNPDRNHQRLVLIDGLDECNSPEMQSAILKVIAKAIHTEELPLIFLIASRPEQQITYTFNSDPLTGMWHPIPLDDKFKPYDDIRRFLTDKFQEIKNTHVHRNLIPDAWPLQSDIENLVEKSSGQFIYASVAVKYISELNDRPHRRLEVVMGLRPARGTGPFAELDALYIRLLECCDRLDVVKQILYLIAIDIAVKRTIETLLDLEAGEVQILLAPLISIVQISDKITFSHESFVDFLLDVSRSSKFHLDAVAFKETILSICVAKLMNPSPYTGTDEVDGELPLLSELATSLKSCLENLPCSQNVESTLMSLSLRTIWNSKTWTAIDALRMVKDDEPHRPYVVWYVVESLYCALNRHEDATSNNPAENAEGFRRIYHFHVSDFELIFRSQLLEFCKDPGFVAFMVLAHIVSLGLLSHKIVAPWMLFRQLLHITEESLCLDDDNTYLFPPSFANRTIFNHFEHLAGVFVDGHRCAQTALRLLEFLCASRPRYLLYHWFKPKTHKLKQPLPKILHRASNTAYIQPNLKSCHFQLLRTRIKRRTKIGALRQRREEKHSRGVGLCLSHSSSDKFDHSSQFGLEFLPHVLERSAGYPELVDCIRTQGRNIAFFPTLTRKAICAMHKYLERVAKDAELEDLINKFTAMKID